MLIYRVDLFSSETYNSPCFQAGLDYFHNHRDELNQKIIRLVELYDANKNLMMDGKKVNIKEIKAVLNELFSKEYGKNYSIRIDVENDTAYMIVNRDDLGIVFYEPDRLMRKLIKQFTKKEKLSLE